MLNRRVAVHTLLQNRGELVVVAGLGAPAYDVASCGDSALDFPLWGAMGGAAMVGLGLALAQPQRRILVITGDGEMLMGIGSLATIASQNPPNLRIVVLDNERYGETGQQVTHTARGTDLAAIAAGASIQDTRTIYALDEVEQLRHDIHRVNQTLFAVIKVVKENEQRVLPPRDGAYLTQRMRMALLAEQTNQTV